MSTRRSRIELTQGHRSIRDVGTGADSKINEGANKALKKGFDIIILDLRQGIRGRFQKTEFDRHGSRSRGTVGQIPCSEQFNTVRSLRKPDAATSTITGNAIAEIK